MNEQRFDTKGNALSEADVAALQLAMTTPLPATPWAPAMTSEEWAAEIADRLAREKAHSEWVPADVWSGKAGRGARLHDPVQAVAEAIALNHQICALRLRPWETPPCWYVNYKFDDDENVLVKRMKAAGISLWHSDPMKALQEAKGT
jgi:hypothetical protein